MRHTIKIEDGKAEFVYSDELVGLTKIGDTTIERASHVEPASTVSPGTTGWIADMRPSGGKILTSDGAGGYRESDPPFIDGRPFETREAALQAEREWLRREKGL